MEVKPVRRYRSPAYPTRLEVQDQPELLLQHVPRRWQKSAVTMAALTACLGTNSCVHGRGDEADTVGRPAVVAPVFKHGDGRGATGCVAVTPPAFVSEEEALVIIREELAKVGIAIAEQDVPLPGVEFCEYVDFEDGTQTVEIPGTRHTFVLDAVNRERRVAVEFLSKNDYPPLGGIQHSGSVRRYDFIELARGIAKTVRKKGKGIRLGVFYDPMTPIGRPLIWDDEGELKYGHWPDLTEVQARNVSREKLRLQVKDFVDWLKGQGVI